MGAIFGSALRWFIMYIIMFLASFLQKYFFFYNKFYEKLFCNIVKVSIANIFASSCNIKYFQYSNNSFFRFFILLSAIFDLRINNFCLQIHNQRSQKHMKKKFYNLILPASINGQFFSAS